MTGLKSKLINVIYSFFRIFPVNRKRVLLFSYYGEQYSGSPKYIGKYLVEQSDLELVWAFVFPEKHSEVSGKVVRYGHLKYYYVLATAGTIITNYRMTEEFKKRPCQKYIQTWHSSLRLKMIENDAVDTLPLHYIDMAKKDSAQIDYLLAGSEKSREIFKKAFWYDGRIENTGTPQCDILFQDRNTVRKKVLEHYHIPEDGHIVLYAPTFRKNHDLNVYNLDTEAVMDALKKKFGGNWYFLMRLHPHLINMCHNFHYSDIVLQATDYDDVQELLVTADILISDYSAIIFDFLLTKRPCFLYMPDYAEYIKNDRNLYFDIKELPFKGFEKQEDLLEYIQSFSLTEYERSVTLFLDTIGSYDDGKASQRVFDLIKRK